MSDAHTSPDTEDRMKRARALYLAVYESQGGNWEANESKQIWCYKADRYLELVGVGVAQAPPSVTEAMVEAGIAAATANPTRTLDANVRAILHAAIAVSSTHQALPASGRLTFCERCEANRIHLRAEIVNGVQTFECPVCTVTSTDRAELPFHQETMTGLDALTIRTPVSRRHRGGSDG